MVKVCCLVHHESQALTWEQTSSRLDCDGFKMQRRHSSLLGPWPPPRPRRLYHIDSVRSVLNYQPSTELQTRHPYPLYTKVAGLEQSQLDALTTTIQAFLVSTNTHAFAAINAILTLQAKAPTWPAKYPLLLLSVLQPFMTNEVHIHQATTSPANPLL